MQRRAVTAATERVLGIPVGVAVPVQRHPPQLVLAACGLELLALAALGLTQSLAALTALAAVAAVLAGLASTNRRRVLAVTRDGILVIAATLRRRPLAPVGYAPPGMTLPEARGVGAPVDLADGRWWVDRSDFSRLRRARDLDRR